MQAYRWINQAGISIFFCGIATFCSSLKPLRGRRLSDACPPYPHTSQPQRRHHGARHVHIDLRRRQADQQQPLCAASLAAPGAACRAPVSSRTPDQSRSVAASIPCPIQVPVRICVVEQPCMVHLLVRQSTCPPNGCLASRRPPPASWASSRRRPWSWASPRTAMASDASPRRRCRRVPVPLHGSLKLSAPLLGHCTNSVHRHASCSIALLTDTLRQTRLWRLPCNRLRVMPVPRVMP